jgi:protein-tyrosine phosphatase
VTTRPRLLTVCLGNICRSPTAEAALREAAGAAGVAVEVASAGTGGWHVGAPPDPRQRHAAGAAGLTVEGQAAVLDRAALERADLVLVMDRGNLADVEDLARRHGLGPTVRLLRSYDPASVAAGQLEVPDPYQGGPEGFEHVVAVCRAAAHEVIAAVAGRRPHPPADPAV